MKKTNAEHQAKFRQKAAEEKKRIQDLLENYNRPDIESRKKLFDKIKRAMRDVSVCEDGKFRAVDKYRRTNTYLIEGLEYLVLELKKTKEQDRVEKFEKIYLKEIESHKNTINEIRAREALFD